MIKTFVIVLAFTDWDDCWNWAHDNDITDAETVCEPFERNTANASPLAPTTSPRPKARGGS